MSTIYSNYEALSLTGTMSQGDLGNGVTANTIHRVFCLSGGTVDITPMKGGKFTWSASTNDYMDVVLKTITVSSGVFIGFRAKFVPNGFQSYQGQSGS